MLRKYIKKILVPIVVGINRFLVKIHFITPRIVIYVDGGLCSQMNMWVQGQYYKEQGLDVYYDLDWFKKCGKGIDGTSIRNYELDMLWPGIKVKTLSSIRTAFYKYFLFWPENACLLPNANQINRSVYFSGYNHLCLEDKIRLIRSYFSINTAEVSDRMCLNKEKRYCGVHVRRGDLANISIQYYDQVAEGYFIRAIHYVQEHERVDEYLLFSEDSQWLRDNILPYVNVKCRIVEGNKGYEDLALLAQCQIIISSQGSFGVTAALMNPDCELLIRNTQIASIPYAKREIQIM